MSFAWFFAACTSGAGTDSADTAPPAAPVLRVGDADNYRVDLTLDIGSFDVSEAQDLRVDWSRLTRSLDGEPLSRDVLTTVRLSNIPEREADEVADLLARGELLQSEIGLTAEAAVMPNASSAWLSEFMSFGAPFLPEEAFVADPGTWMFTIEERDGTPHSALFVRPGAAGDGEVFLEDRSAQLTLAATLPGNGGVAVSAEAVLPTLDWTDLGADARGGELDAGALEEAVLHHLDADAATVAAQFADLAALPGERWSASIGGASAVQLGTLIDDGGVAFPGFTDGGTWVLTLGCGGCRAYAPPVAILLAP